MGCKKNRKETCSIRRETQQRVRYWGCGELGHCLWTCPSKAAKKEVQHKEERKLVPKTGGRNKVERKWQTKEKEVANRGQLVERNERGWIKRRREEYCVVSIVTCGYCGEEGTAEGGNSVKLDYIHDIWCERYGPKKEWLDREVAAGRKSKMKCTKCGKKWVAARREKVEEGECSKYRETRRRKEAAQPHEVKVQPKEKAKEERDVRRIIKMLKEVWMQVGLEKVDSHEEVSVKALLDSGAMGMFADKKFVEKNGFKLEKLNRPVRIRNIDGIGNSGGLVTHEIEVNVYYQGHVERMRLDVCNLGRTEVILGMPWLAAHNPEINWETGEVKMMRCPPLCGKNKERKEKWKLGKRRKGEIEEEAAIR